MGRLCVDHVLRRHCLFHNDVIRYRRHTVLSVRDVMMDKKTFSSEKEDGILAQTLDTTPLRKQHLKVQQTKEELCNKESQEPVTKEQPVTCFLYPGLTPGKLRDHLTAQGASDACILEWMRRLQEFRLQHLPTKTSKTESTPVKSYGVKLLGK